MESRDAATQDMPFGICRFCSQTVIFKGDDTIADDDEAATLNCTCPESGLHRTIARAYKSVHSVCVERAEECGFTIPTSEYIDRLKENCKDLVEGTIGDTAINVSADDVIKIKMKDGHVLVSRKRVLKLEAM